MTQPKPMHDTLPVERCMICMWGAPLTALTGAIFIKKHHVKTVLANLSIFCVTNLLDSNARRLRPHKARRRASYKNQLEIHHSLSLIPEFELRIQLV